MATCRICKLTEYDKGPFDHSGDNKMIKYGTRHYAHAGCALDRWGTGFFDKLTAFQCGNFPYYSAKNRGYGRDLEDHCNI